MKFSNLTNKEYLRLNGTLSFERMEELALKEDEFLETKHQAENAKGVISEILNIAECYMNDWNSELSEVHSQLCDLKKVLRGENKELVNSIIDNLEEYQSSMTNAYDYMIRESKL